MHRQLQHHQQLLTILLLSHHSRCSRHHHHHPILSRNTNNNNNKNHFSLSSSCSSYHTRSHPLLKNNKNNNNNNNNNNDHHTSVMNSNNTSSSSSSSNNNTTKKKHHHQHQHQHHDFIINLIDRESEKMHHEYLIELIATIDQLTMIEHDYGQAFDLINELINSDMENGVLYVKRAHVYLQEYMLRFYTYLFDQCCSIYSHSDDNNDNGEVNSNNNTTMLKMRSSNNKRASASASSAVVVVGDHVRYEQMEMSKVIEKMTSDLLLYERYVVQLSHHHHHNYHQHSQDKSVENNSKTSVLINHHNHSVKRGRQRRNKQSIMMDHMDHMDHMNNSHSTDTVGEKGTPSSSSSYDTLHRSIESDYHSIFGWIHMMRHYLTTMTTTASSSSIKHSSQSSEKVDKNSSSDNNSDDDNDDDNDDDDYHLSRAMYHVNQSLSLQPYRYTTYMQRSILHLMYHSHHHHSHSYNSQEHETARAATTSTTNDDHVDEEEKMKKEKKMKRVTIKDKEKTSRVAQQEQEQQQESHLLMSVKSMEQSIFLEQKCNSPTLNYIRYRFLVDVYDRWMRDYELAHQWCDLAIHKSIHVGAFYVRKAKLYHDQHFGLRNDRMMTMMMTDTTNDTMKNQQHRDHDHDHHLVMRSMTSEKGEKKRRGKSSHGEEEVTSTTTKQSSSGSDDVLQLQKKKKSDYKRYEGAPSYYSLYESYMKESIRYSSKIDDVQLKAMQTQYICEQFRNSSTTAGTYDNSGMDDDSAANVVVGGSSSGKTGKTRGQQCLDALKHIDSALYQSPHVTRLYCMRAKIYAMLHMDREALRDIETAHSLDGNHYHMLTMGHGGFFTSICSLSGGGGGDQTMIDPYHHPHHPTVIVSNPQLMMSKNRSGQKKTKAAATATATANATIDDSDNNNDTHQHVVRPNVTILNDPYWRIETCMIVIESCARLDQVPAAQLYIDTCARNDQEKFILKEQLFYEYHRQGIEAANDHFKNGHIGMAIMTWEGIMADARFASCVLPHMLYSVALYQKYLQKGQYEQNLKKLFKYDQVALDRMYEKQYRLAVEHAQKSLNLMLESGISSLSQIPSEFALYKCMKLNRGQIKELLHGAAKV